MENFKYKVSIIVPVYNVEPFVAMCLDSLVNQTMNLDDMEIIVVNDGSTDNSYEICKSYAEKYDCIKLFTKENEGLSATRNYGIKRAQGKYLMFIDSDDYLTEETVKEVTDYFDIIYNQVDLVAYYEQPYSDDKLLPVHYRFKYYLTKTGVYDLYKHPYITQTRINVCVKNMGEQNILFDTTPGFRQEDQEYNNRVLMNKMKMGYCSKGVYMYNRSNDLSIVATTFHAYYIFETSTAYFERLFSYFEDEVPKYFQSMFVNDINWKLKAKILFPFHYEKDKFNKAIGRLIKLLNRVDNDIILNHPQMANQHKYFWLALKENSGVTPFCTQRTVGLLCDGRFIDKRGSMEFRVMKFQYLGNNKILFRGHLRCDLYNYINEKADVRAIENGDEENPIKLKVYPSKYGYHNTNIKTNNYYGVEYEIDTTRVNNFKLVVLLDGFSVPVRFSFNDMSGIIKRFGYTEIVRGNTKISYIPNYFELEQLTKEQAEDFEIKRTTLYPRSTQDLRIKAIKHRQNHRVWLYFDLYTVKKDNGLLQFIHDLQYDDGVERYYVINRDPDDLKDILNDEQMKRVIQFGSEEHKLLYLSAELILTAYYGRSPISPFESEKEESHFYDIEHFRTVYLQHGVLHASLYVQNSCENCRAEKIVISSEFEKENYTNNYNYREDELIPAGMPRYDFIDRTKTAKNKILFAPSWREYLTTNINPSKWELAKNKILRSDYYKKFSQFIESERLNQLLSKYDMHLELKLHPIIASATDLFNIKSDRIKFADSVVDVSDYSMFITDFSSFVFDYAYLNRPVLYFVPDYEQFKSGMGHYRDLDLPFEKAFGPLVLDSDSAIDEIEKAVKNDCKPQEIYSKRMENFYYPLENCREKIYQYIVNWLGE